MQFLSWSLLLAPHAVQGDQERPFLSRELRRGVLTQGEKRISRDRALVIGEERRGGCERSVRVKIDPILPLTVDCPEPENFRGQLV